MKLSERIIILAAGVSSRMKEKINVKLDQATIKESNTVPKFMIRVGKSRKPFLDYLLMNIANSRYTEVIIVINPLDHITKQYYNNKKIPNLNIKFCIQEIPNGRLKPLGTSDAVLQALNSNPDWEGCSFTVCNADNLYSKNVLELISKVKEGIIDYEGSSLGLSKHKIYSFAIISKNSKGYLTDIIEKPKKSQIFSQMDSKGRLGVSMNIFRLKEDTIKPYLINCPLHSNRNEKELPNAIKMMINDYPDRMRVISVSEKILDLTEKSDINKVNHFL